MTTACAVCGNHEPVAFLSLPGVPVHQNLTFVSASAARNVQRGDIELVVCAQCEFVCNAAFDARLLHYSPEYDNTQTFSAAFREYMRTIVDYLIRTHDLHNKSIVEVGCGKGDFLKMICQNGGNRGLGFDPSYVSNDDISTASVQFVRDFYSSRYSDQHIDFVCCRHVIEHLPEPQSLVRELRATLGNNHRAGVFFETPTIAWIFDNLTFWDLFYEHCSYFTANSLRTLFVLNGFDVLRISEAFGGQYLWLEAAPSTADAVQAEQTPVPANVVQRAKAFAASYFAELASMRQHMAAIDQAGRRWVIWGAGAKGVTFMNALGIDAARMPYIVDMNPRKHARYVPGTAQEIVSPEQLVEYKPAYVLVMNPLYLDEVRMTVRQLGLDCETRSVATVQEGS